MLWSFLKWFLNGNNFKLLFFPKENTNIGGIKIEHLNNHVQLPEIFIFLENILLQI